MLIRVLACFSRESSVATGVGCILMGLLFGKRPLLAVQPEAVAWDSNGVDVAAIVVRIDAVGMDGQRYPPRYWEKFHPRKYWGN